MIPLRLRELGAAQLVDGDPDTQVSGVVCDSRLARPGALFVCLPGARHDGHAFIADAAARGATAVLCEPGRGSRLAHLAVLEAERPLAALAELAHTVRWRSRARVVGIGGSAGKTSAKDTLRALLAPQLPLAASPASYNNELGVPLTLALLEHDTAICVCELGTGAPGELASLCRIATPDVGMITALGPEHLAFFGSLDAVAAEEAALIAALPSGAPIVLPADADLLEPYRRGDLDEWRIGLDPDADVRPLAWRPAAAQTEAVFSVRGERVAFTTNLRHPHHRLTLAAALAVYAALGLPLDRVGEGAAAIELSPCRGQEQLLPTGVLLINDAYNANPLSLAAALRALAARRDGGRAIAVLGEMAELGPGSCRWHADAGRLAAKLGLDLLIAVGPGARAYLDGAAGILDCRWLPDTTTATQTLGKLLHPGDVVLIKGSRSAGLERIADALTR
jgi:UDP-N-acetylmuramoyl-tripeptide--D-alanyl-D-alanine ligase